MIASPPSIALSAARGAAVVFVDLGHDLRAVGDLRLRVEQRLNALGRGLGPLEVGEAPGDLLDRHVEERGVLHERDERSECDAVAHVDAAAPQRDCDADAAEKNDQR